MEMNQDQITRTADDIRSKRISQELALLEKLDKDIFTYTTSEDDTGFSISIQMNRAGLEVSTELIDDLIQTFEFEIFLPVKYPFVDPQIMCLTKFSHSFLSMTDGRDIFNEIVGEQGWRVGFKLYTLVCLIPEFIQDMLWIEDNLHFVGCFHLGQIYHTKRWQDSLECSIFNCSEQSEIDSDKYFKRKIVITKGALLLFEYNESFDDQGKLLAWASLQSIARIRRNSMKPQLVSIIFKHDDDKQPWVLNLNMPQHDICCKLIVTNLTNFGVENKKKRIQNEIKPKIAEIEVTKDSIKLMDLSQILENTQIYEQALMESDPSSGGQGFDLSTIQTLLTLYQKLIEYYSAIDNELYIDVKNRMQSLINRPEIEVLLAESRAQSTTVAQSEQNQEEQK